MIPSKTTFCQASDKGMLNPHLLQINNTTNNATNTTKTIMYYIPAKELPESALGLASKESRGSTTHAHKTTIIYTHAFYQYKPHFSSTVPSVVTDR